MRIGIFSCQDWEAGYYTAHAGLAAEDDLDLVVCLGDYVYERSFYEEDGVRNDDLGANGDGEVQTLAEYRDKYSLYHSDANLPAPCASSTRCWGSGTTTRSRTTTPATCRARPRSTPACEFTRRRRNGYRAYFEHMPFAPADGRPAPAAGPGATTARSAWAETPS